MVPATATQPTNRNTMTAQRKRITSTAAAATLAIAIAAWVCGCITKPQNPSATQPATAIDPATTQPSYWLAQPAVAQVQGGDFDALWDVCKTTARGYLFQLDRMDPRSGVLQTAPMVSKQIFEPWRSDAGTLYETFADSLGAIRRTLRFELSRNGDGTYTATPKVLIERESILERHITDVSQYRTAFSGPSLKIPTRESVLLDPETVGEVAIKYWYPTGRDEAMERQVADRLRKNLAHYRAPTAVAARPATPAPADTVAAAPPFAPDGAVSALAADGSIDVNVGAPEKVVAGMTFEVYADRATLPTLATYASQNPSSKGWIEVVSVATIGSKCRVIKSNPNDPIKSGDQLFNFVFERGRVNHFAVAGDFASIDRDTLTGLIWRWNGAVDPKVVPETHYLLLGMPPKDAAGQAAYDAAKSTAEQLKTPTVTEDRFNLLIRYYDPSKR
jgi:hypothetical protein